MGYYPTERFGSGSGRSLIPDRPLVNESVEQTLEVAREHKDDAVLCNRKGHVVGVAATTTVSTPQTYYGSIAIVRQEFVNSATNSLPLAATATQHFDISLGDAEEEE